MELNLCPPARKDCDVCGWVHNRDSRTSLPISDRMPNPSGHWHGSISINRLPQRQWGQNRPGLIMLTRLFQKFAKNEGLVGISRSKAGVALAQVLPRPESKPCLTFCDFLPGENAKSRHLLNKGCHDRGVSTCQAVCVLEMGCYQLLQMVPPDVPRDEMREAIRWQIGDLIDYPPEEAVVDFFSIPSGNQREQSRSAYVVVAHQDQVAERVAWLRGARLKIRAVDIPELVLCNLLNQLPDTGRVSGFCTSRRTPA